ncbi:MAG: PIN domain-containing protein [Chloroflexota bacterium]|nr:PIN domain-containing protein [Chloroflexota bacterium]
MTAFVDTSAFFAVLDVGSTQHAQARSIWQQLLLEPAELLTSSYVLLETFALVQRRLGMAAVRTFQEDVLPVILTHWIDESLHAAAVLTLLAANRRNLSLVDCASFIVMRRRDVKDVFAFDDDFRDQGFNVLSAR